MSVFVHAEGIKTVHHAGGEVKKWQISVHVVVEWPLNTKWAVYFLAKQWQISVHVVVEWPLRTTKTKTTLRGAINCYFFELPQ